MGGHYDPIEKTDTQLRAIGGIDKANGQFAVWSAVQGENVDATVHGRFV